MRSVGGVKRTGAQLLEHLRLAGAVARHQGPPRSPIEETESAYARYLRQERGVSETTVDIYLRLLRAFLVEVCAGSRMRFAELTAGQVAQHVLRHARVVSAAHAKLRVTALRSFLRFLHVRGFVTGDLATAVPTVPRWQLSTAPKGIPPESVQRILDACEWCTRSGRRDYAVLLLLARLGLRAGEVTQLTLDDVHWEAGELLVRGKGLQHDRLPLPADVGQALVQYLRRDRPRCASRRLFLGAYAPLRGFGRGAVSAIVERAIRRAGLETPSTGAHLLRHSLATNLLRRGGSLAEIGEILRHRTPQTTLIYAKVDVEGLRAVAPPWPGTRRDP